MATLRLSAFAAIPLGFNSDRRDRANFVKLIVTNQTSLMCDTFIALTDATRDGSVIFGKNSDRPAGEVQDVVVFPAQTGNEQPLRCTYIEIPQVVATASVILSKPRWMWGAEMGANQYGVVIGNEAVWTNQPYRRTGLLGMDLVRLGLERGNTASAALQIIVDLLAQYGQGGNCSSQFDFTYHNSFLIADSTEAWVLETADIYWVAEQVRHGTRSISNGLTIRGQGDLRHPEVVEVAIREGRCADADSFDFAALFAAGLDNTENPASRAGRVKQLCRRNQGKFTRETAQEILKTHAGGICMHGDFETRGSQVSILSKQGSEHWLIDQPFPCQQQYRQYQFSDLLAELAEHRI